MYWAHLSQIEAKVGLVYAMTFFIPVFFSYISVWMEKIGEYAFERMKNGLSTGAYLNTDTQKQF